MRRLRPGGRAAAGGGVNITPQLSVGLTTFSDREVPDPVALVATAATLDRAGFDRLVVSDHVVFGEDLEAYGRPEVGGTTGGRQPTGPDGHWLEPLTTLAYLAAGTERIRLATGILIAALRRPVVLAKTAATIDVLSGGRLDLGVGIGWQREEYEAAGLDFHARGRLLDHTLEVCRTLWTEPVARIESEQLTFDRIHMMPKPVQAGGVPLWISGRLGPRVVDRLCRFGPRWIPWGDDAADLATTIPAAREMVRTAGGPADALEVVANLRAHVDADGRIDVDRTLAPVPDLLAAGATDFLTRFRGLPEFEALAALVHAFRSITGSGDTP